MKIITNKNFYKNIFAIAIPITLQNLIVQATSMMDSIMLGRADNTGIFLSASSLANQPFFILSLATFGMASAATVMTAQYWGKRDTKAIREIIAIALKAAFVIAALVGLAVLIVPEAVMGIYTKEPQIIEAGAKYLRIIGYAYFTFGLSNTMICAIRSVELVKVSVVANLSSFFINTGLNYLLIFGKGPFPAMGIEGAALATLIARLTEFAITFVYVLFIDKRLAFRLRDMISFNKVFAKDLFRYGSPVFINELMWAVAISMQSAILGHITYTQGDPVAANSIASMVQQLSTVVIFAVANAAAVIIGKSIGEGKKERALNEAYTFKYLAFVLGIAACAVILLSKSFAIGFYTIPEETKALASQLLTVVAFVTILVSTSSIYIVGILRAGGDTRFCLFMEMGALWFFAIPLAIAGVILQLSVPIVLILMKMDEPVKTISMLIRMRNDKWLRSLTR